MRRKFYIGFAVVLIVLALFLMLLHAAEWMLLVIAVLVLVGIYDVWQKKHTILRNFPVLGHIRFILEFFRPEIQQYFVADDTSERPFDRDLRSIVYERAKSVEDTMPFGTDRNIYAVGYEWVLHSLAPKHVSEVDRHIMVGGPQCKKPYKASRLNISAMSFGALSANAILALNKGAKIGGFYHNTGEGGLSDHHLAGGGDICWQLGTAYFGCRDEDGNFDAEEFVKEANHEQVKMIEIKLSQGAKPSHGGILPAEKLTPEIARIRKVSMGHDVISPPAHTAFSNPEGLLKFVKQLRELTGGKPIGFKLCIGKKEEFLGICKAMVKTKILPDFITVDGAEGGTGAAPMEFSNRMGVPLKEGLPFVHNALIGIGVRDKIRLIASGKVITGFDMVSKLALGADMINCARGMMMSLGCIQSRQCNTNTCPTGVATQNKRLMKGLVVEDKKVRVANFHENTLHSFAEIVGAMGLTDPSEVNPDHVLRRIDVSECPKTYRELYHFMPEGELLKAKPDIQPRFLELWKRASATKF